MKNERAILVVDDEPLIRMDLSSLLEDHGFEVFEAGNAHGAETFIGNVLEADTLKSRVRAGTTERPSPPGGGPPALQAGGF